MSFQIPTSELHVLPEFQPAFRELGLDASTLARHPDIKVWRKLDDRENATLDFTLNGKPARLHIKRYPRHNAHVADAEIEGHRLLVAAEIPTAQLVAWGKLLDGGSFTAFEDLAGYSPADKLIASGTPFDALLTPTADLAAKLHGAGLHHRDLYLCHFFAKEDAAETDVKLIDVARVAQLPRFFRRRWIVKDLAQFWYSMLSLPIVEAQRDA